MTQTAINEFGSPDGSPSAFIAWADGFKAAVEHPQERIRRLANVPADDIAGAAALLLDMLGGRTVKEAGEHTGNVISSSAEGLGSSVTGLLAKLEAIVLQAAIQGGSDLQQRLGIIPTELFPRAMRVRMRPDFMPSEIVFIGVKLDQLPLLHFLHDTARECQSYWADFLVLGPATWELFNPEEPQLAQARRWYPVQMATRFTRMWSEFRRGQDAELEERHRWEAERQRQLDAANAPIDVQIAKQVKVAVARELERAGITPTK